MLGMYSLNDMRDQFVAKEEQPKPTLDMVVERLEAKKELQNLSSQNELNQAKMARLLAKLKASEAKHLEEARASGQLQYQSTNPDDGYNYPIAGQRQQ